MRIFDNFETRKFVMLKRFKLTNYLSFKEEQTLDFTPESLKEHSDYLHIPYLYSVDARVLKAIAILGHNSHGKSNFIKGYQFFLELIFSSFAIGRNEQPIQIDNFRLSTTTAESPSTFEAEIYIRDTKYRYGFQLSQNKVSEEWLYYSEPKIKENYLFVRAFQDIKVSKLWSKECKGKIEQSIFFTKATNLLLSVLISQGSVPRISEIAKWFRGNIIISDITAEFHIEKAVTILSHPNFRSTINSFLQDADLGFVSIVEKIDSHIKKNMSLDRDFLDVLFSLEIGRFELYAKHDIYDGNYNRVNTVLFEILKSESSGTIKYLVLVCYLSYAIKQGQLILVDEIDSKFHALLLKHLLKTYLSNKMNVSGSQMIFTTHNTFILGKNVLRRDQISIVEKNQYGESSIKRMHGAKKPLRVDTQVEREYLKGDLGGVSEKLKKNGDQNELDFK